MCLFTNFATDVFVTVSAVMCIVFGSIYIFAYFATLFIHDPNLLIRGFFLLLLGSCIMADPGIFLYVVVFAASFFMIFMGIEEMTMAMDLEQRNVKNWWIDLIYAILSLGCGIAILVVEFTGGNSLALVVIMAGAFLIVEGIFELVMIFALHRDFKRFTRVIDE
jgi:uncharacterized membrane protein HdeD (DUF308 family)